MRKGHRYHVFPGFTLDLFLFYLALTLLALGVNRSVLCAQNFPLQNLKVDLKSLFK